MKFDIIRYGAKHVMNCKTEEEAAIFLNYLNKIGRRWRDGSKYSSQNLHFDYGESTCYSFNSGTYTERYHYEKMGYVVLNFEDFEWDGYNLELELSDTDINKVDKYLLSFLSINIVLLLLGILRKSHTKGKIGV